MLNDSEKIKYLRQALKLAYIRKGECAPNPSVGCVVVKDGQVLAEGYHKGCGHPHAEVEALSKLNNEAEGATVYVTLEPCCHWGRTPPCTSLLIRCKVAAVIYGYPDPNPKVNGQSQQLLQTAGINCEHFVLPEINQFYKSYDYWWSNRRPFVTAKLAISLDGKIAGKGYIPIAITGEQVKQFTHQQRKIVNAILTTASTLRADNPLLTVRLPEQSEQRKPVYILDSQLALSSSAKIFKTAAKVTLFHGPLISEEKRHQMIGEDIRCISVSWNKNGLNLKEVMRHIGEDGVHDLWVEAGGTCFSALIKKGLVQKAYVYIAPKLLGSDAISAFNINENIFDKKTDIQWLVLGQDIIGEISF